MTAARLILVASLVSIATMTIAATSAATPAPSTVKANVYAKDHANDAPIFTYLREAKTRAAGGAEETGVYKDPSGAPAVEEKVELGSDGKLISYEIDQKQTGSKGRVERKDGKYVLTFAKKDGPQKEATEPESGPELLVGPTLIPFAGKRWNEIQTGKSVEFRFAVPERREAIKFAFTKEGDQESKGRKGVRVRMAATSAIVRAFAPKLYFTLSADGSRLLQFEGRTLLKKKSGGDWSDLDALTIYE